MKALRKGSKAAVAGVLAGLFLVTAFACDFSRAESAAPAQDVTLEFLDSAGKTVGKLTGGLAAGRNEVVWDTSGLVNGVYFCRITARRQDGKKLVVMKKLAVIR